MTKQSPESADIDALESLVISEGWQDIVQRVSEVIEAKRDEMERYDKNEARAIPYMQGYVAGCRLLLMLPAQRISEIQNKMKEK